MFKKTRTKQLSIIIVLSLFIVSGFIYRLYVPAPSIPSAQATLHLVQSIPVSLDIQGKTYQFSLPADASVYDMMRQAQDQTLISFNTQDFKGLGKFVNEINGIKNSDTAKMYWVYYVNSKSATQGISEYKLQPNDTITWQYEKSFF